MAERRRPDAFRYQLPFEWSGTARELGRHVREIHEPLYVRTPSDVVSYFVEKVYVPFEQFRQEQLYVLLLDQKNRITHDVLVYKGTVNAVNVRTAELFMEAVHFNSPSIIVAHNHPSGDATPSPQDIAVTGIIYEAGKILDISVLDHLIIGHNQFVSLRAQNLGFPAP